MPSFSTSPSAVRDIDTDSSGERYTRALVALTREVWHPDCSFDAAVGLICETAAEALRVERVNVWRYDAASRALHCIHAYTRSDRHHARAEELETLPLDGDYEAALRTVRSIDAADVETDPSTAHSVGALRDYLHRHRIRSLLDAPVCIEGELLGVICHENVEQPAAMDARGVDVRRQHGRLRRRWPTRSRGGRRPKARSSTCACTTPPPTCPTATTWSNCSASAWPRRIRSAIPRRWCTCGSTPATAPRCPRARRRWRT